MLGSNQPPPSLPDTLRAAGTAVSHQWRPIVASLLMCWAALAVVTLTFVGSGVLSLSDLVLAGGPGAGERITAGEGISLAAWTAPLLTLPWLWLAPVRALSSASEPAGVPVRAALPRVLVALAVVLSALAVTALGLVLFVIPGLLAFAVGIWAAPVLVLERPGRFDRLVDRCLDIARSGGARQLTMLLGVGLGIVLISTTLFSALAGSIGLVMTNLLIGPLAASAWWLWVGVMYVRSRAKVASASR